MMNLILSSAYGNVDAGSVSLKWIEGNQAGVKPTRMQRSATLDGGAIVSVYGETDGDRTLNLDVEYPTAEKKAIFDSIFSEVEAVVAIRDGVFYGGIQQVSEEDGLIRITFLPEYKL